MTVLLLAAVAVATTLVAKGGWPAVAGGRLALAVAYLAMVADQISGHHSRGVTSDRLMAAAALAVTVVGMRRARPRPASREVPPEQE